jgi:hypothetical protein
MGMLMLSRSGWCHPFTDLSEECDTPTGRVLVHLKNKFQPLERLDPFEQFNDSNGWNGSSG